jgi:uncharacterized protein
MFFLVFRHEKLKKMAEIIGRLSEQKLLQSLAEGKRPAFVAVYGRRRVGKTYLIRSLFEDRFCFYMTGIANVDTPQQLTNFHAGLQRFFPQFEDENVPVDWFKAFQNLIKGLESLPREGKKILFFDELPWLDTPNSLFISALEHFWNSWGSVREDIMLIVCGSAASWMVNELINNTGGLYNRITHSIEIMPFTLAECEAFFKSRFAAYNRYQLLQLYMVFGGIPFYLDEIDPEKSFVQNVNDLCFTPRGRFRKEFEKCYTSLFKKSERHLAIVTALAKKSKGLNRSTLLKAAKLSDNGSVSNVIRELEESHFIRKYQAFGKKKNGVIYQLCDFFSLFHLKFIQDNNALEEDFWINGIDSPAIRAWSGYAFEQVCLAHIPQLKKALGISSVQTQSTAWAGSDDEHGTQIDLVIERRDQVINLCEMKFSIKPYTIDKEEEAKLRKKMEVFQRLTKTNKALWLTFVTTFGLAKNHHAQSVVQQSIMMDALFEA